MVMKKLMPTLLFLLLSFGALAQEEDTGNYDELTISGLYSGKNIYVLNPSEGGTFSVQSVSINGKEYAFNHESNAFEISLQEHQLNDFIFIQVQHSPQMPPLIINGESLVQEKEFPMPSFLFNKKSKMLEWKSSDMCGKCEYRLEQLLYGKWVKIKEIGSPEDLLAENYLPVLLSGMNLFRIIQTDSYGAELSSPIVRYKSPNRKVLLMTDKVKDFIEFTAVTHYELYDANGFFIKRGTAQKVNVTDLKKGTYWINFDGKEAMVTKK